jgi:hypothetical protein
MLLELLEVVIHSALLCMRQALFIHSHVWCVHRHGQLLAAPGMCCLQHINAAAMHQ